VGGGFSQRLAADPHLPLYRGERRCRALRGYMKKIVANPQVHGKTGVSRETMSLDHAVLTKLERQLSELQTRVLELELRVGEIERPR